MDRKMKKTLRHLQSWSGCYCILLLALISVILLCGKSAGRYQAIRATNSACWVINTKTSRLWIRSAGVSIYCGTNTAPCNKKIESKE